MKVFMLRNIRGCAAMVIFFASFLGINLHSAEDPAQAQAVEIMQCVKKIPSELGDIKNFLVKQENFNRNVQQGLGFLYERLSRSIAVVKEGVGDNRKALQELQEGLLAFAKKLDVVQNSHGSKSFDVEGDFLTLKKLLDERGMTVHDLFEPKVFAGFYLSYVKSHWQEALLVTFLLSAGIYATYKVVAKILWDSMECMYADQYFEDSEEEELL